MTQDLLLCFINENKSHWTIHVLFNCIPIHVLDIPIQLQYLLSVQVVDTRKKQAEYFDSFTLSTESYWTQLKYVHLYNNYYKAHKNTDHFWNLDADIKMYLHLIGVNGHM